MFFFDVGNLSFSDFMKTAPAGVAVALRRNAVGNSFELMPLNHGFNAT